MKKTNDKLTNPNMANNKKGLPNITGGSQSSRVNGLKNTLTANLTVNS